MRSILGLAAVVPLLAAPTPAGAGDLIATRAMSLELARDLAQGAVNTCRAAGYQVAAVVVDRSAVTQVVLRDVYATGFNTELARRKANAVILAGVSTREFLANRPDMTDKVNRLPDVLVLRGGVPIRAAGALLGALGVSGAPGGEADEGCALSAVENVQDRLDFAD